MSGIHYEIFKEKRNNSGKCVKILIIINLTISIWGLAAFSTCVFKNSHVKFRKSSLEKFYKFTQSDTFLIKWNGFQYLTLGSQETAVPWSRTTTRRACVSARGSVTWQSFIVLCTEAWSPIWWCCFSLFSWVSNQVFIHCTLFSYSDHDSNKPSKSWIWTDVTKRNSQFYFKFKSLAGHYCLQIENSWNPVHCIDD